MSTEVNDTENRIKVRIGDNFFQDGIDIFLLREDMAGRYMLRLNEEGFITWETIEQDGVVHRPTMTLPGDLARALLDALMRHYQGASDMHTVRQDLLHERRRVDKMLDAILSNQGELSANLGVTAINLARE
jgi:hypothetical protein